MGTKVFFCSRSLKYFVSGEAEEREAPYKVRKLTGVKEDDVVDY